MGVIKRNGQYGIYWGNAYGNSSDYLTEEQRKDNAIYIYKYLTACGWSLNAICGLLGNIAHEGVFNPGMWQGTKKGNGGGGYGLIQWTPSTEHTGWCSAKGHSDPSTMDVNLKHIVDEIENNRHYKNGGALFYPNDYTRAEGYNISRSDFKKSTENPSYLACALAWERIRSAVVLEGDRAAKNKLKKERGGSAISWYNFLVSGNYATSTGTFTNLYAGLGDNDAPSPHYVNNANNYSVVNIDPVTSVKIKLRRGTEVDWEKHNTILADGQPGYDKTNNLLKIGNGKDDWKSLPYLDMSTPPPPSDSASEQTEISRVNSVLEIIKNEKYFYRKWASGLAECFGTGDIPDNISDEFDEIFMKIAHDKYFKIKGYVKQN